MRTSTNGRELAAAAAWSLAALAPGVLAFQPTFGGLVGAVPGAAGVLVGVAVGAAAARWRWGPLLTVLALVAAYFGLGGAAALPQSTIAGVIPTLDSLQRLLSGVVRAWRDLLTVSTPAGDFVGPAVVPWLSGLVLGCLTVTVAARTRRMGPVLLAPLLWLAVGVAFGVQETPLALAAGLVQAVVCVAWLAHRQAKVRRAASEGLLIQSVDRHSDRLRRTVTAGLVLSLAGAGAFVLGARTSASADRHVLREVVAPPLNLTDYPTPLSRFRLYETDLANEVLFTITGVPAGARVRLATMDTYDGIVYNVSRSSADYLRVGRRFASRAHDGVAATIQVSLGAYQDVWLPLVGTAHGISITAPGQAATLRKADGLHLNRATNTALTTAGVGTGDRVSIETVVEAQPSSADGARLARLPAGRLPLPQIQGVPEPVATFAADAVGGESTPFAQLSAIESLLKEGYYSNGSDGLSRSGHTTERLATMFTADALIGDDEQYATAMALMANQLGVPTRVVLGFRRDGAAAGEWKVTGTQAHVWVESYLDGAGWVAFDPTPDRKRTPKTEIPQPRPKPRPMVEPPPNPPEQPADPPRLTSDDLGTQDPGRPGPGAWLGYLLIAVSLLGALGLLAAPFVAIVVLKQRRRRVRRTDSSIRARFSGAWEEVLDRARDLGVRQPAHLTRRESAAELAARFGDDQLADLAARLDHGTFAPSEPLPDDAERVWDEVVHRCRSMAGSVPWHRRWRARFALGSLAFRGADRSRPGAGSPTAALLGRLTASSRVLPFRRHRHTDAALVELPSEPSDRSPSLTGRGPR